MKITKFKLKQGTYPFISYADGNIQGDKNFPTTEAPPKMLKAMMAFNNHVTEITEQFDKTGNYDYDNVCTRSYSVSDKDTIVLTGLRTLSGGCTLVLNSKSISLDTAESSYPKIGQLLVCLENMQTEIEKFMKANPSQDDIQGKLQFAKLENVIMSPEKTAEQMTAEALSGKEVDVTDLYKPKEKKGKEKPLASEMQGLLPTQEDLDKEMPLTTQMQEQIMKNNAEKNRKGKK